MLETIGTIIIAIALAPLILLNLIFGGQIPEPKEPIELVDIENYLETTGYCTTNSMKIETEG